MRANDEVFSKDLYMNGLVIITALFVIALLLINPPTKDEESKPLGNLVITAMWVPDADIDLWVLAPQEPHAIGYSSKSGISADLLRDDLGLTTQKLPAHYENFVTRGVIPGEYIVNLHVYRGGTDLPLTVTIQIDMRKDGHSGTEHIASRSVELTYNGEEQTALRFRLDKDGNLVPGSINHVQVPLRDA